MGSRLISGNEISSSIYGELRERIAVLRSKGVTPGLAVVLVGEDPASQVYVRMKGKKCEELGMHSVTVVLPKDTSERDLLSKVDELNNDAKIHGFLVQLPLPKHIDEDKVINSIDPRKDVDGFHPNSVGSMLIGRPSFLPATPAGVQQMLIRSNVETAGRHAVIVGRSNIVGKPMAAMLVQKGDGADATVTVVHSRTKDLAKHTLQADILIVAIGKARFVTKDMVKDGAVVIDVGTNRVDDPTSEKGSRLVGDVDFDNVKDIASAITPVPGGVGPMTICMLMANTVKAAELSLQ
ncbi:MAG: bifunctional 5,10-methylene-tetrahydrofolate dehydrogenase/5,10-methylene-tetrahydrofolate cyclohydrolase [Methanomassiliicoccaceae archaeon]|jgi:methylenetetrahydrofolate dehydrogenase (NADP+)/methenyltetrahydrofolate cyclohydrolase|nr:bifunctional 5,10-methylene-tetrahydrofolate dehydrogenase/5,10-methylene-tetrahydrofolate cyclohydrolase [Methanomassiliicoccaceae archaeon]